MDIKIESTDTCPNAVIMVENACAEMQIEIDMLKAKCDEAESERNDLVKALAKLFDWEDMSYIHAIMHVENAVNNLRTDLAVMCDERNKESFHANAAEADAKRLRELIAHAAPIAWVSDSDMDSACSWEREAAPFVYAPRNILDAKGGERYEIGEVRRIIDPEWFAVNADNVTNVAYVDKIDGDDVLYRVNYYGGDCYFWNLQTESMTTKGGTDRYDHQHIRNQGVDQK